jgi:hypothetical protein
MQEECHGEKRSETNNSATSIAMKTALLLFMLSGQSLDLTSTWVKLNQGCHEGNVILKPLHITTGPRIAVLKGGLMVGMTIGFEHHYQDHPKAEAVLMLVSGGAGFAAGAHNLTVNCHGRQ